MKPKHTDPLKCAACGSDLGKLVYFCGKCWPYVPAKERVALYQMHARKENTDTKVQKCLRMMKRKQPNAPTQPRDL